LQKYCFTAKPGSGVTQSIEEIFNAPVLALDAESTGLNTGSAIPVGVSVASRPDAAFYLHKDYREGLAQITSPDKTIFGHNIKYDRSMLKKLGFTINNVVCTLVACHMLEMRPADLKTVNKVVLDQDIREYDDLPEPVQNLTLQEQTDYSGPHSYTALQLWDAVQPQMIKKGLLKAFTSVELPLIPVLSDMELNGNTVSAPRLKELGAVIDQNINLYEYKLKYKSGISDVNWNSPDQVADVFYKRMGIKEPWQKTSSGRGSMDMKILEKKATKYPIIADYIEYKHMQKLKGTYIDGILERMIADHIFGNFNQEGTGTSRLSSSDPNLQNIPVKGDLGHQIRTAWTAPYGTLLIKADMSQLELRMIAHWSQDKNMLAAFRAGRDIHMETAMLVWGDPKRRPDAKTLNFQIVYGGGEEKNIALLKAAYPGVFAWIERASREARECHSARTLFGRLRSIDELKDPRDWMQEHGERMAISTMIQGSSAEIVKILMRRVWEGMHDTDIKMVLQVHDELVFEVPIPLVDYFAQWLYKTMRYDELSVPFVTEVKVGKNWGEMSSVKEDQGWKYAS
jgi:DNA polymerase-1